MQAETVVTTVRIIWLTLCGMMLFSRFAFQYAGAEKMRAFLNHWVVSKTKQYWGIGALLVGGVMFISMLMQFSELSWLDRLFTLMLVGVLAGDGLLNFVPAYFGHFKENMQKAWVKQRGEKSTDRDLFGVVNFLLGLASVLMGL